MITDRSVDLLYVACNRREFTIETFSTLLANTDWPYVRRLFREGRLGAAVNELLQYSERESDGVKPWLRILACNFSSS